MMVVDSRRDSSPSNHCKYEANDHDAEKVHRNDAYRVSPGKVVEEVKIMSESKTCVQSPADQCYNDIIADNEAKMTSDEKNPESAKKVFDSDCMMLNPCHKYF